MNEEITPPERRWRIPDIAEYIGIEPKTVRDDVVTQPWFPKPEMGKLPRLAPLPDVRHRRPLVALVVALRSQACGYFGR